MRPTQRPDSNPAAHRAQGIGRNTRRNTAGRSRQSGGVGRGLLYTLAAVALLLGLVLAALTWGPNLLRETVAARSSLMLGRTVDVDHIRVSPFAGRAEFSNLVINSLEPGKPMLTARRVELKVDPLAYLRGVVVVRSIELDEPRVRIVRTAPDRLDLSDVIEQFTNRPASLRRTDWRVDRIAVHDGSLAFDDRVVKKLSRIDAFQLSVSGLTNLESQTDSPAALDATFKLDDRPVTLDARATLFAQAPAIEGRARLDALPVATWLPYMQLPADVRPSAGTLDADLRARYLMHALQPDQLLRLEGTLALNGAAVTDRQGTQRVAARRISAELAASNPLGGEIRIAQLAVLAPVFAGGRAADGSMLWPVSSPAASSASPAAGSPARTASIPPSPASASTPVNASRPISGPRSIRIDRISIQEGQLLWSDASLPGGFDLKADPFAADGGPFVIADLESPSLMTGQARIQTSVNGETPLVLDLSLNGPEGRTKVDVQRVPLARYAPLAGNALKAKVERGTADASATVNWNSSTGGWSVDDLRAALSDMRLTHPRTQPLTSVGLKLSGGRIDGAAQRIEIDQARLERTQLTLARDAAGRIDLQQWFDTGTPATSAQGRASVAPKPAWSLLVRQAEVDRLELDYTDALIAQSKRVPRVTFSGKAKDVTLDPGRKLPFEGTVSLADGSRLRATGSVQAQPLNVDAKLQLQQVDLTYFDPYIAPYLNLTIARGQLWGGGRLQLASTSAKGLNRIGFDGEVSANNLVTEDKLTREDFVRWGALAAPSVTVDWRPDQPDQSSIRVGDVAFVDFYARVILSQEGRLNLSNVLVSPDQGKAQVSLTDSAVVPPAPPGQALAPVLNAPTAGSAQRSVATVSGASATTPTARVSIGTIRVASGNVVFTDLFIRPNYTANLTQLAGAIDALASDQSEPANVLITGRVDDDTPLEITGKVNPLAPRKFVDLRAVARGFDLPKISAYSGRWAGYAIEKGKLSANVRYKVEGDKLDAENKLTINQLTFGDKVESRDALKLPLQLAVSLLKDADGNIDLDLPITGTLSDPQFSVGGLIWRAVGNLIVRVVTSPFRFLASLGKDSGAGADLSQIEFSAGDVRIDEEDRKRLDGLASGLAARPALTLEIVGYADPSTDSEALQGERLERALRGTKLGDIRRANKATELTLDTVSVEASERASLVERLWRAAKLDATAQGKAVSEDEMERQLLARNEVAIDDLRQLAQRRAESVRNYLREERGIGAERLYVLAPRVGHSDVSGDASKASESETAPVARRVAFAVK